MTFHSSVLIDRSSAAATNRTPATAAGLLRAGAPAHLAVASLRYDNVEVALEPGTGILWFHMRPLGRPVITSELMADMRSLQASLQALFAAAADLGQPRPFSYFVVGSRAPGVYNLGGNLAFFVDRMRAGDRAGVHRYARDCVDQVYQNSIALELPIVTMGLVQGDALGGGFELALSYDMIVAERSAKLGLPEILFNLFPGMGAYSFLTRRVGAAQAKEMVLGGRLYTAEELHGMGVVDVLAEDGRGEDAVCDHVRRMAPKQNAERAFLKARRRVNPVTHEELCDVVDTWTDAVFELGEADLKKMMRLVNAQDRRLGRVAATPGSAVAA